MNNNKLAFVIKIVTDLKETTSRAMEFLNQQISFTLSHNKLKH